MSDEQVGPTLIELEGPIEGQWLIAQWHGRRQYTCQWCKWDTLEDLTVAREHAAGCAQCHPSKKTEPRSPIAIADKYGRELGGS